MSASWQSYCALVAFFINYKKDDMQIFTLNRRERVWLQNRMGEDLIVDDWKMSLDQN